MTIQYYYGNKRIIKTKQGNMGFAKIIVSGNYSANGKGVRRYLPLGAERAKG